MTFSVIVGVYRVRGRGGGQRLRTGKKQERERDITEVDEKPRGKSERSRSCCGARVAWCATWLGWLARP